MHEALKQSIIQSAHQEGWKCTFNEKDKYFSFTPPPMNCKLQLSEFFIIMGQGGNNGLMSYCIACFDIEAAQPHRDSVRMLFNFLNSGNDIPYRNYGTFSMDDIDGSMQYRCELLLYESTPTADDLVMMAKLVYQKCERFGDAIYQTATGELPPFAAYQCCVKLEQDRHNGLSEAAPMQAVPVHGAFCRNCGKNIGTTAQVCPYCGMVPTC